MFGWRSNADRANGDTLHNLAEQMAGRPPNAAEQTAFVTLIGEIAGQIDLLNASIEAACDGKVGREFTVIADEVRTLAGEVRQAADGIAAAVTASGVSHEVAAALEGIKDAIRCITELMTNAGGAALTSHVQKSQRSC